MPEEDKIIIDTDEFECVAARSSYNEHYGFYQNQDTIIHLKENESYTSQADQRFALN